MNANRPAGALEHAETLHDVAEDAKTLPLDSGSAPAPVDPGAPVLDDGGFESRYAARALLGQGGMGEVRLCHDARIGRDVAMKVIKPGAGSRSDARARFLREARVQGQLEHPAVVPVYDLGVTPAGDVFFTMKRIRGTSLEEIIAGLRRGDAAIAERWSRRKLLTAFESVCLAVHFAHERGVLHRDLKPGNVMLGSFGEVYVLDWGLAKVGEGEDPIVGVGAESGPGAAAREGTDVVSGAQTREGEILGTPGYMAPEQVRGEQAALDRRCDVYALGSILHELLALEPLHPRHSIAGIIGSTLSGPDARPSRKQPEAGIAPELDEICVTATQVDRERRFASAREMHDALERFLDGDRDLALRRDLATRHAGDAERALADALAASGPSSQDARTRALREVGRALALDPANPTAMSTLVKMLVEPPKEMPPEADAEFVETMKATDRMAARLGGFAYAGFVVAAPLLVWMGVRDWTWIVVSLGLLSAASVLSFAYARRGALSFPWLLAILVTSTAGIAASSRVFGPFVLVPVLVLANTVVFAMTHDRRYRMAFNAVGMAGLIVPIALELSGVVPSSYAFDGGVMQILPHAVELPALPTLVNLGVATIGILCTTAWLVGRMHETAYAAERRMHLQSWQLRQLVPREVLEGMGRIEETHKPHCPIESLVHRP